MEAAVLIGLAMLHWPWSDHHAQNSGPPPPLSISERRGVENRTREHLDYPMRYVGRPFEAIGTAYKVPFVKDPFAFQETRTNGAAVDCSSFDGPILYGTKVRIFGVLEAPVFRWDDLGKKYYLKDCAFQPG